MKKLALATERNASGVLTSDKQSRDIHIDNFTMSFHGRLLVDGASIVLNYGQRYGLLGENGSGKTTFLEALAHRDVEIPEHVDVSLPSQPPSSLSHASKTDALLRHLLDLPCPR